MNDPLHREQRLRQVVDAYAMLIQVVSDESHGENTAPVPLSFSHELVLPQ